MKFLQNAKSEAVFACKESRQDARLLPVLQKDESPRPRNLRLSMKGHQSGDSDVGMIVPLALTNIQYLTRLLCRNTYSLGSLRHVWRKPHSPNGLKGVEDNRQTPAESVRHYRAVDLTLEGMMPSLLKALIAGCTDDATGSGRHNGQKDSIALNWAMGVFLTKSTTPPKGI